MQSISRMSEPVTNWIEIHHKSSDGAHSMQRLECSTWEYMCEAAERRNIEETLADGLYTNLMLATPLMEKQKRGWHCQLEFKLEDMWIGAYWRRGSLSWDLWICLVPCVPLHISWR